MKRRKRQPRPWPEFTDNLADPRSFASRGLGYLKWLEAKGYSPFTVVARRKCLQIFIRWAREQGVESPEDVTRMFLERYQRWCFTRRSDDGKPWGTRYQHALLETVRSFFSWCAKNNFCLFNPASELELPRIEKSLPKFVLTVEEVEKVLAQPDLAGPAGLRDRAMMETLYSTGIRRMELANLGVYDVDASAGTTMVRKGKGRKDRVVPIGERALLWIQKYLDESRPFLIKGSDPGVLFLSNGGDRFNLSLLGNIVSEYVDQADIRKTGACHLFRHTAATLMLERGADIRFIQALLGHESISTTQIYTEVSIRKLKEVHTATHPSAKMERAAEVDPALSSPAAFDLPVDDDADDGDA